MSDKIKLIDDIIKIEWEMFITVNDSTKPEHSNSEHPSCRDFPDEFKIHRTSNFIPWSEITLESYLNDISNARSKGINLMTYKYARMDDLIPRQNQSLFIDKIITSQVSWQKQFIEKYPKIMSNGRPLSGGRPGIDWASFETYLRAELETYSDKTLELLYIDIENYKVDGKSMSEDAYRYIVKAKGYQSLEDAEEKMTS